MCDVLRTSLCSSDGASKERCLVYDPCPDNERNSYRSGDLTVIEQIIEKLSPVDLWFLLVIIILSVFFLIRHIILTIGRVRIAKHTNHKFVGGSPRSGMSVPLMTEELEERYESYVRGEGN